MAPFDCMGILRVLIVLSLLSASSAEVVFQEGCSLLIDEGSTLTITCLADTTADIDFLFNSSLIGTCIASLELCNSHDKFTFSANTSVQPYQYVLTSKTGVDNSFSGLYYCRDATDTFESGIDVSVAPVDIDTFDFVEDGDTVLLTLSCYLDVTMDDLNVEWFTFDNTTLTKLNLPSVSNIIDAFSNETNCTACGSSGAQNISTGLTFKPMSKTLTYVYLEVHLSHPNFSTRNRTGRAYPAQVVEGDADPSEKGSDTLIIVSIICPIYSCCVIGTLSVFFRILLTGYSDGSKKRIGACYVVLIIIVAFILTPVSLIVVWFFFLKEEKANISAVWCEQLKPSSCIAICSQLICKIDTTFRENLSTRWYCKEWNKTTISNRKELFSIDNAIIEEIWQDKDARSYALSCFFKNATEEAKTEIFTKVLKNSGVQRQPAHVLNELTKLLKSDTSHQNSFLSSLGQCPIMLSLLWSHLKWRLKTKLFVDFWTSLNTYVQNAICKMIFDATTAERAITSRIANSTDKGNKEFKTVEQLHSFLSKCESAERSIKLQNLESINNCKANRRKLDDLFGELSTELKLKMMGYTDGSRLIYVASAFWKKWIEHEEVIPFEEILCVDLFLSKCTESNFIIRLLEQKDWEEIKKEFRPELCFICMHVELTETRIDLSKKWMKKQEDATQIRHQIPVVRHLNSFKNYSQGNTIACKGETTHAGVTRIQLYFDDKARRTEEPSIAVTITSTTPEPLCNIGEFNKNTVDMLKGFALALYLRGMPALEGSANKAEGSTELARRDILNVLGNNIVVEFHEKSRVESV